MAKICIAHRGASAYAPEHTIASYLKALQMKADYVEQDLQITKDGTLICLHDETLSRTTNVEKAFPDRFREQTTEKGTQKIWRAVDFTLAEIKTLDAGGWKSHEYENERVPTFAEAIALVKGKAGIYPETKAPGFYDDLGFEMEKMVLAQLEKDGLHTKEGQAKTPVFLQSFSAESLKRLRGLAGGAYKLVQLMGTDEARAMLTDRGLDEVKKCADAIGPDFHLLAADPTRVEAAHKRGLAIHPYTFNQRNLPPEFKTITEFMSHYLEKVGVDGLFTDNADLFPGRSGSGAAV